MKVTKFISHRGANSDFIENTMQAFQLAYDFGFEWIELDVQMTVDKELIIFHDRSTIRLSDIDVDVTKASLQELKSITLINSEKNLKAKIPTLKEYFDWMMKNTINTNLEIKINTHDKFYQQEIVTVLLDLLSKYSRLKDRVFISSFSNLVMMCLKQDKLYRKALLYDVKDWDKESSYINSELYQSFITDDYIALVTNCEYLTVERVKHLKDKFGKIFVYSAVTDDDVVKLIDYGVDSIFIDKKEQMNIKIK